MSSSQPAFRSIVLDTTDPRGLAEFYRQLLGYVYGDGYEPSPAEESEPADWLVLHDPAGGIRLAFQGVEELPASTWPGTVVPQQLHLDFSVPTSDELARQHARVLSLGGHVLQDRFNDPDEPIYVFADPAWHPFCIFVLAGDDLAAS